MKIGQIKYYIQFWKDRIRKCKEYGWTFALDAKYRKRIETWESNKRAAKLYGYTYAINKGYIKRALFERDGGECFWCHQLMSYKTATVDHIVKIADQPKNNRLENLRLIHNNCRVERDTEINKGFN